MDLNDQVRDILFIGHATPEDNDFAIWLASRLELLGYNVWIDKNYLLGGEKFWEEIDQIIRNKASKYLLVYSQSICQKDDSGYPVPGRLKDGISKEYSLAESISKENSLKDFILLLNVDSSTYNLFIGADRLNQIPFFENWAEGFKQLEKKLERDLISKNKHIADINFGDWYENQYNKINNITQKNELYYSNWWIIKALPESFYIYQFQTAPQAQNIHSQKSNYPISKSSNCLCSFQLFEEFFIVTENERLSIKPIHIYEIKISDIISGYESKKFPTNKDAENHLKQLLKRVFHLIMRKRGLSWYEMANRKLAYFHTFGSLKSSKVLFEYPYRNEKYKRKTKNLIGDYLNIWKWHYAVSAKSILKPFAAFSLKSHLVFTNDGFKIWKNKDGDIDKQKLHSHRRKKASMSRFFNEEWRDMFLAFLKSIEIDNKIEIELCNNFILKMESLPEMYWADFGYGEPNDKTRHDMLSFYEFEDEEENEEEYDDIGELIDE